MFYCLTVIKTGKEMERESETEEGETCCVDDDDEMRWRILYTLNEDEKILKEKSKKKQKIIEKR